MSKVIWGLLLALSAASVQAGVLDPDCTMDKAAKSAAMKATIGVSGRCSAKEAVSDSVGMDDKKDAISDAKKDVGKKVDHATDDLGKKAVKKALKD